MTEKPVFRYTQEAHFIKLDHKAGNIKYKAVTKVLFD